MVERAVNGLGRTLPCFGPLRYGRRGEPIGLSERGQVKRTLLKARSEKRRLINVGIRGPAIQEAVERGQLCQAAVKIAAVDLAAANRCELRARDWHEVQTRGRGGSIVNVANRLWVCRRCHDWIGTHPALARLAGVVLNSWDDEPGGEDP